MPIQVLEPQVRAKIAAGEVVERPGSVVKELIENSIDAGASRIDVEIKRGGCQFIRVTDDGAGIPEGELDLAFQRYATSKLSSAEDLHSIRSLGFRGEALPSIAAVARVELTSCAEGADVGAFIRLEGGSVVATGRRAWAKGTSVVVRNLFYNVPARLKFLRSEATETAHIAHTVTQYGLAFPEIRFTLSCDDRTALRTSGSGDLYDTLAEVYGVDTAKQLLSIDSEGIEGFGSPGPMRHRVYGYVSLPSLTRTTRSHISFLVNRRWIRSPSLAYALEQAYEALLPSGRHPVAVVYLEVPPEELDVNVHPTKAEVKFQGERRIWGEVHRTVKDALTKSVLVRAIEVPRGTSSEEPAASPDRSGASPALPLDVSFATETQPIGGDKSERTAVSPRPTTSPARGGTRLPILRVVGQVGAVFIVAEGPEGLYLIDQHRGHERVLYEKFQRELQGSGITTQQLLEPLVVELSPKQRAACEPKLGSIAAYGFAIESFGPASYLVRAAPASLRPGEIQPALLEIIDSLAEGDTELGWRDKLISTLACRSAVKKGQALSHQEMRELIEQLEQTAVPQVCPHGAPAMLHLSQAQLEKEFYRR